MSEPSYIENLVARAKAAQHIVEGFNQQQVDAIVRAMGKVVYDNAELLAKEAVDETGYGTVASKIVKQRKCTVAAWHYLKDKPSVGVIENDPINKLVTFAKPVGVVAVLVPTTNPTSTPVSNGMSVLKCRNAMIVSPHPRAQQVTRHVVQMMSDAIRAVGAPEHLIQVVENPSMESTSELMARVDVVVATGGAAMVKAAYASGRPSYGVGQGNTQVIVAEDYKDYAKVAENVISSRAYDNGMACTGEQAIHIKRSEIPAVLKEFAAHGAALLPVEKMPALTEVLFRENCTIDPAGVGMTPVELAKRIGMDVPADTQILLFPSTGMTRENLLRKEKLCPVVQYFPYDTFEEAVANAKSNFEWEGAGHSAVIYTNDEKSAEYAGLELPISRLLVNQPGAAAAGGNFINGLNPTMSLGCGSWGNNSISENLTYRHLMNTTRLAYYHDCTLPAPEVVWAE